MVYLRAAVLGRMGSPTSIQERVLYPAHRPPFTGRGSQATPGPRLRRSVNYVSLSVLRYAAAELAAIEATGRRVSCMWQPDSEAPQCGREAEYLVEARS